MTTPICYLHVTMSYDQEQAKPVTQQALQWTRAGPSFTSVGDFDGRCQASVDWSRAFETCVAGCPVVDFLQVSAEMSFGAAKNECHDNLRPAIEAPFGPLFGLECGPWR